MKIHSTNYFDTFIEVAEDTKASCGIIPQSKTTIAEMQYDLIANNPYLYTSDEVFFRVFAQRKDPTENELPEAKVKFFSKGQPCFRASPLTKSYGFGVHADSNGRVALGTRVGSLSTVSRKSKYQKGKGNAIFTKEVMSLKENSKITALWMHRFIYDSLKKNNSFVH
jgi:hypothetical protein